MEKLSCSRRSREAWTALEDEHLREYVKTHGPGKWSNVSQETGLQRSGKSCRLRWLNYLRPDIKRGNMSPEEEDLIIRLHKLLGNRWSLIAGRLPGRSDNEIKNYWNTTLVKRVEKEKEKDKDKETPKMDGGLVNNAADMKTKSCELWADPMTEDYPPDPSMNFPENLFQHEDHTVSDCDHLWNKWNSNFSHFDDDHGIWGNGNSSTAGGANALWSDFFT